MYLTLQEELEYQSIWWLPDNQAMKSIGDRIREARTAKGMSQAELAKKIGLSQGTIGHIEAGRNEGSRHLALIAAALGVRAEYLQTGRQESAADWPFPGVSKSDYLLLPQEERDEIVMLIKAKISRYIKKSSAAA